MINGYFTPIMIALISFLAGYTVTQISAQNQTTTNAPIVIAIDQLVYVVIIPIVISILGIVKGLVDKGFLSKKIGTVTVMAADAAHAVGDTRTTVNRIAQNSYDVAKLTSPEAAKYADDVLAPTLDAASDKLQEYKPKIDVFESIAKDESDNGEKTTDEIKAIKKDIPDEIIS